jgi:sugar phosphate isomerase/epimerase
VKSNTLKKNPEIGYCGNVHPAISVDQLMANLQQHTAEVKRLIGADGRMPFGIWVSATALEQLQSRESLLRLKATLEQNQLVPFTINGFPFGDFHQAVVKRSVYLPDWTSSQRLDYTLRLADLHHELLPPDAVSTISTLPLGWPADEWADKASPPEGFFKRCAENLITCARELDRRYQQTGRRHIVCIEPEPGCVLDCCGDVVNFFERYLFSSNQTVVRKHIGVCHDICHSAVMFESQDEAIAAYANAGIQVGKIQVSSAVEVDFDRLDVAGRKEAREQLSGFNEPKYLHQTSVQDASGKREFFVDLPEALAADINTGVWRVHFHVPIFYQGSGLIGTTQPCIGQCLEAMRKHNVDAPHFEVETYAWPVLPKGIFAGTLTEGIAEEIRWFKNLISQED